MLADKEKNWDALNSTSAGILNDFVHKIRRDFPNITKTEARIKVLADQGYDSTESARILCMDVDTLYNHRSHMRTKTGAQRNMPFRAILRKKRQYKKP